MYKFYCKMDFFFTSTNLKVEEKNLDSRNFEFPSYHINNLLHFVNIPEVSYKRFYFNFLY